MPDINSLSKNYHFDVCILNFTLILYYILKHNKNFELKQKDKYVPAFPPPNTLIMVSNEYRIFRKRLLNSK